MGDVVICSGFLGALWFSSSFSLAPRESRGADDIRSETWGRHSHTGSFQKMSLKCPRETAHETYTPPKLQRVYLHYIWIPEENQLDVIQRSLM